MSYIIRYIDFDYENKTVAIKESFLGFLLEEKKDAESIKNALLGQIMKDELNFSNCRSQCYDNANVMSGNRGGLQTLMQNENPLAFYNNCNNHTLNLVGMDAVKQDILMIGFFGVMDTVFNFFGRSTLRWDKLKKTIKFTLKSQSETRWSSRTEAVRPLYMQIKDVIKLLDTMSKDEEENSMTRSDAFNINIRLHTYDFLFILGFWNEVLPKIDRVQKRLQDPSISFRDAALDLDGLKEELMTNREAIVDSCIENGIILCRELEVPVERRARRVNTKEEIISKYFLRVTLYIL